jgi:hypothetical protein
MRAVDGKICIRPISPGIADGRRIVTALDRHDRIGDFRGNA